MLAGAFPADTLETKKYEGDVMQKLDSEKFRAVLEAIAAEKGKRRNGAVARPWVEPQTETTMSPADFEVLSDKPGLDS